MTTNVDQELPLKFKPFKKVTLSKNPANDTNPSALIKHKIEMMKLNQSRAKEEFIKNKFQRPSQLIAPIDAVDYFREQRSGSPNRTADMMATRSNGCLLKNNQTQQL